MANEVQLTKAGAPRKQVELRYKDLPPGGVRIVPIEKRGKKKKEGTEEKSGRFSIWHLPWDADASVAFKFPEVPAAYRINLVAVTIGPIGAIGLIGNLVIRDGAGNIAGKVCSPSLTATADDSVMTFAADLPFASPSNGGVSPFCYTASLPVHSIILPNMRWEIQLGAAFIGSEVVRGVCVLTESLTEAAPWLK